MTLWAAYLNCSFPVGIRQKSWQSSSLFLKPSSQVLTKPGNGNRSSVTSKVPISFVCSGHSGYHYHLNGIFLFLFADPFVCTLKSGFEMEGKKPLHFLSESSHARSVEPTDLLAIMKKMSFTFQLLPATNFLTSIFSFSFCQLIVIISMFWQ